MFMVVGLVNEAGMIECLVGARRINRLRRISIIVSVSETTFEKVRWVNGCDMRISVPEIQQTAFLLKIYPEKSEF
jgi:hypothetical protein